MKSILISIKPEWVAKILNGEKTIEVRKTKPKCELPIEVYIYCTKAKPNLYRHIRQEFFHRKETFKAGLWNGMIVAKFTLRKVEKLERYTGVYVPETILHTASIQTRYSMEKKSCLSMDEIWEYTNGNGYAWHIDDLIIFVKPKELDEFDYPNPSGTVYVGQRSINGLPSKKHPPQSWCYVEERK